MCSPCLSFCVLPGGWTLLDWFWKDWPLKKYLHICTSSVAVNKTFFVSVYCCSTVQKVPIDIRWLFSNSNKQMSTWKSARAITHAHARGSFHCHEPWPWFFPLPWTMNMNHGHSFWGTNWSCHQKVLPDHVFFSQATIGTVLLNHYILRRIWPKEQHMMIRWHIHKRPLCSWSA